MGEIKAGRELDAFVAEKVMGLAHFTKMQGRLEYPSGQPWKDLGTYPTPPPYSTDIAAAMEVAKHVRAGSRLYDFSLWVMGDEQWGAEFVTKETFKAWADTAPHAICLAALKFVGAI